MLIALLAAIYKVGMWGYKSVNVSLDVLISLLQVIAVTYYMW